MYYYVLVPPKATQTMQRKRLYLRSGAANSDFLQRRSETDSFTHLAITTDVKLHPDAKATAWLLIALLAHVFPYSERY